MCRNQRTAHGVCLLLSSNVVNGYDRFWGRMTLAWEGVVAVQWGFARRDARGPGVQDPQQTGPRLEPDNRKGR